MDHLWGLRALEDLEFFQPPRESPHPPEAGDQVVDAQTPNNIAESGNQVDHAPQTPNNVAESENQVDHALQTLNNVAARRIRAGMCPETPLPFSPQIK
ncbi:MAG: hypothetical protein Q9192_006245 [Flavoplaca navasiana]